MAPTSSQSAVDAVILAAGQGQRLGYPKALLSLGGRWVLPQLVRSLRHGGCRQVVVVTRPELVAELGARGGCGADEVLLNPLAEAGRSGSVQLGLNAIRDVLAPPAAMLIHPCDVPLLGTEAVQHLIRAWRQQGASPQAAARLVTPGGRGGHPLLLGAGRFEELLALRPDQSLRELLHGQPQARLDVCLRGDPGPFLDVDTPEQKQLLEDMLPVSPPAPRADS